MLNDARLKGIALELLPFCKTVTAPVPAVVGTVTVRRWGERIVAATATLPGKTTWAPARKPLPSMPRRSPVLASGSSTE